MLRLRADDGLSRSSFIHVALNSDNVVNKSEMGHQNTRNANENLV